MKGLGKLFKDNVLKLLNEALESNNGNVNDEFENELLQQAEFCLKYGKFLVGRKEEINAVINNLY